MTSFIEDLDDFENVAVNELIKNKNKIVFIKSYKFTGKTTLSKKLYNLIKDGVVIYHSGCDPKYFADSYNDFKSLVEKYEKNYKTIILDEYYNHDLLDYINKLNNIVCYIFTNDLNIYYENASYLNYYKFYKKFIENICFEYRNIYQMMFSDKKILDMLEKSRIRSSITFTKIKYKGKENEYRLEY